MNRYSDKVREEQVDQICDTTESFLSKPTCPYTAATGYLNRLATILSVDKMPKIRQLIAPLLARVLGKKSIHTMLDMEMPELTLKNDLKLKTYIYNILFLKTEVYDLIQKMLQDMDRKPPYAGANHLQDREYRQVFGYELFGQVQRDILAVMKDWHIQKKEDENFRDANVYASKHSQISKGQPLPLAYVMTQGFCDGFTNFWSLIYSIPELYIKQYKQPITAEKYREIVEKNIKKVMIPLSSLNLQSLVGVIRPDRDPTDMKEFVNNSLGIDTNRFVLDEEDGIMMKNKYMHEVANKMTDEVHQYWQAQAYAEVIGGGLKNTAEYPMRTGCPALAIEMKDNKRMVEQFCYDVLALLDKIYFPYWDK